MPRYLITVTDEDAARLESWLGGPLHIGPVDPWGRQPTAAVAGLDAVTDEELAPVLARLRTGGPLYRAGGPGAPHRKYPDDLNEAEAREYRKNGYLPLADDDSEAEADAAEQRAAFMLPSVPVQDEYVTTRAAGHEPLIIDVADLKRGGREEGCPDGGKCHHECTTGCFRVRYASPLGAAGWGDQWPEDIWAANAQSDGVL